jgi:hypothetical protein
LLKFSSHFEQFYQSSGASHVFIPLLSECQIISAPWFSLPLKHMGETLTTSDKSGVPTPLLFPLAFPLPFLNVALPLKLPLESRLLSLARVLVVTILLPSLSNFGCSGKEVLDPRRVVEERVLCAERRAMAALGSFHISESECGEEGTCGDVEGKGRGEDSRHFAASVNPQ